MLNLFQKDYGIALCNAIKNEHYDCAKAIVKVNKVSKWERVSAFSLLCKGEQVEEKKELKDLFLHQWRHLSL